jgi:hypothetical protein
MPEMRCVHYVLYLRVYFDYKRTWLCQKRVVCIIFDIYVFILIISVPGYARNTPYALRSKSTLNKKKIKLNSSFRSTFQVKITTFIIPRM